MVTLVHVMELVAILMVCCMPYMMSSDWKKFKSEVNMPLPTDWKHEFLIGEPVVGQSSDIQSMTNFRLYPLITNNLETILEHYEDQAEESGMETK